MWRKFFCFQCFFCPSARQPATNASNSTAAANNSSATNANQSTAAEATTTTVINETQPQANAFDYHHMFCSVEPLLSSGEASGAVLDASQCSVTKLANSLLNSKKKRRQVRVILLNGNQLEHIPNRVLRCKKLQVLDLSHNSLTFLPSSLSRLGELRTLLLAGNNLQQLGKSTRLSSNWTPVNCPVDYQ